MNFGYSQDVRQIVPEGEYETPDSIYVHHSAVG